MPYELNLIEPPSKIPTYYLKIQTKEVAIARAIRILERGENEQIVEVLCEKTGELVAAFQRKSPGIVWGINYTDDDAILLLGKVRSEIGRPKQTTQPLTKAIKTMSDEGLMSMLGKGANRPGGYITYSQRVAATELRKRGYRVSEMWGTVKKKVRGGDRLRILCKEGHVADLTEKGKCSECGSAWHVPLEVVEEYCWNRLEIDEDTWLIISDAVRKYEKELEEKSLQLKIFSDSEIIQKMASQMDKRIMIINDRIWPALKKWAEQNAI